MWSIWPWSRHHHFPHQQWLNWYCFCLTMTYHMYSRHPDHHYQQHPHHRHYWYDYHDVVMMMLTNMAYTQNTYGGFTCRCILRIFVIIIIMHCGRWSLPFASFIVMAMLMLMMIWMSMTLVSDGGILGKSSIYRYILRISVVIIIMLKSSWCCSITLIVLSVGVKPRS